MSESTTYPPGRANVLESWRPLAASVLLTTLALGAWQAFAAPRMPQPVMHPNRSDGRLFWVGPRLGPFYAKQDVEAAELLFVGDSRVYDGLDLDVVRQEGEGPAGLIWGPNADLKLLLPAIERLPMKRLVVALSPSVLGAKTNPIMRAVLVDPPPDLAPLSLESSLMLWSAEQKLRLVEEGFPVVAIDLFLANMRRVMRETILRGKPSTREIDRWVRERTNYWRSKTFATVTPRLWHRRWFEVVDPERLSIATRNTLKEITQEDRDATEKVVVEVLARLRESGVQIICVRFPVSASELAIEREFVSDERLRGIAERAGVPYFEYHADHTWQTRDGSHLVWPEARRFTREVLARLAESADQ